MLATLLPLLNGNFDVAEEALQEAFVEAVKYWPEQGIPGNPRAWLVSVGRFKAIDQLRKRGRRDASVQRIIDTPGDQHTDWQAETYSAVGDDRLRLIFICCHPALSPDAQVALTLREVCGLTTEAIAAALIVGLYNLLQLHPSPVIELNRAVAIAMRDGPSVGIDLIEHLETDGVLGSYYLLPAAKADLYRRAGERDLALRAYQQALDLPSNRPNAAS